MTEKEMLARKCPKAPQTTVHHNPKTPTPPGSATPARPIPPATLAPPPDRNPEHP